MGLLLKNVLTTVFILLCFQGFSQDKSINQFDAQGQRNGQWQKQYPNSDQLRYQGQFEHGKEVGTFKFYKKNSGTQPAATRIYFPNKDSVLMRYYNSDGFVVSEGYLLHKQRAGLWKYYFEKPDKQVMMIETYHKGKLNGPKKVYFSNGKIAEKKTYDHGLLQGDKLIYDETGQLRQQYHYSNDTLQGYSIVYDYKGRKSSEGNYKNGLRDGKWKFYKEGKLDSTATYPLDTKTRKAIYTKDK